MTAASMACSSGWTCAIDAVGVQPYTCVKLIQSAAGPPQVWLLLVSVGHLNSLTAPTYTSVAAPFGTAFRLILKKACDVPHPGSPQFVNAFSLIDTQLFPPSRLRQTPWSAMFGSIYHAYISLRPGTTASSPR